MSDERKDETIIECDELARMRKNSERWKFAEKHWHYDVGYDSKEQMNAAVDAAIAAEMGKSDA